MFELNQFISDCRAALATDKSHKNVREVVARAVSDPAAVLKGLGEPKRSEVQKLYHASDLTILNVVWAPRMTIMPHNHQMWAVIGIYTGREDNIFWRRVPGGRGGKLEAAGAMALSVRDVQPLGDNIIHSVTNPIAPDWCHSRLRWGLFRRRSKRVGSRDPRRGSLRRGEEHEAVRRGKRTVPHWMIYGCGIRTSRRYPIPSNWRNIVLSCRRDTPPIREIKDSVCACGRQNT
jgi:predicted metal-dependent enzyme (double-stranded beta helix superfamily)